MQHTLGSSQSSQPAGTGAAVAAMPAAGIVYEF